MLLVVAKEAVPGLVSPGSGTPMGLVAGWVTLNVAWNWLPLEAARSGRSSAPSWSPGKRRACLCRGLVNAPLRVVAVDPGATAVSHRPPRQTGAFLTKKSGLDPASAFGALGLRDHGGVRNSRYEGVAVDDDEIAHASLLIEVRIGVRDVAVRLESGSLKSSGGAAIRRTESPGRRQPAVRTPPSPSSPSNASVMMATSTAARQRPRYSRTPGWLARQVVDHEVLVRGRIGRIDAVHPEPFERRTQTVPPFHQGRDIIKRADPPRRVGNRMDDVVEHCLKERPGEILWGRLHRRAANPGSSPARRETSPTNRQAHHRTDRSSSEPGTMARPERPGRSRTPGSAHSSGR